MGLKKNGYFNPLAFSRKTITAREILCSLAKSLWYNLRSCQYLNIVLYSSLCQYFLTKTGTQGSAKSRVKITAYLNSLPLLLRSLLEKFCVRSQNLCEKNNLRKTINLLQYFCERKQFLEGMIWCFCVYSCFPWETCVHSQNFCDRNNLGRRKNSNSVGYIYNRTKGAQCCELFVLYCNVNYNMTL